ncbi:Conserved ATP/GTP binding protein [Phaffia rhodozyma]|uniref:Conserved ATP/GTP binding protein n=1 Tax=Phaffia rhodozyma TaxID=264483 RepID=A0A0F7SXH9_PHARH|nr:Conserved ATP/GTP binding protein [Phaffia rhodozyma]
MAAFQTRMAQELMDIDMVIECRDARLPLTSINPQLEEICDRAWGQGWALGTGKEKGRVRERLVVYTKKDLAEERFEEPLVAAFKKHANQNIMFADTKNVSDMKRVLKRGVAFARKYQSTLLDMKILVVGMPNVGKSSLLNGLRHAGLKRDSKARKSKVFMTSSSPGHTKKFTGTAKIHEDPPMYVYDSPGVMVPWFGEGDEGADRAMKCAVTGSVKGGLFPDDIAADYLLYKLNLRVGESDALPMGHEERVIPWHFGLPYSEELYDPTNNIDHFLSLLAARIGALERGGRPNLERSAAFFLNHFRNGKFGRYTLDDLEQKEDLYADPDFSFYPEDTPSLCSSTSTELDTDSSTDLVSSQSPSRADLVQKTHLKTLLPAPRNPILNEALQLPRSFDPTNPPWAPPHPGSEAFKQMTVFQPPILAPSDIWEKVSEAVRRYFFGKERRENQISRTQLKKIASGEKRAVAIGRAKSMLLERQRRVGLAQRPMVKRIAAAKPE